MKRARGGKAKAAPKAKKEKDVKEKEVEKEVENKEEKKEVENKEEKKDEESPSPSPSPKVRSISESWDVIEDWLKTNEPAEYAILNDRKGKLKYLRRSHQ